MSINGYEAMLKFQCKAIGLPQPETEVRFAPPRRWRFDLAWTDQKLAAEVDGGIWKGGRHTRGKGFEADCEKLNEACLRGWRVLRFSVGQVRSGAAIKTLERAFGKPRKAIREL